MTTYEIKTNSEEETMYLAEKLARLLEPGNVITLEGNLGAGKTMFTKGIAKGLGVKRMVTSPTFTIIKEYDGHMPLYHMDVYRLENMEEDIGFREYFNGQGVSVVEWAQFIEDFLPVERLDVQINFLNEQSRVLIFTPKGTHYEQMIKILVETYKK